MPQPHQPHKSRESIQGARPLEEDFVARPTQAAHRLVRERVEAGDRVVDATVGNGHDTVFLAGLVGRTGQVDGFDIQSDALESTRQKLAALSHDQVTLHQVGHETMADLVEPPVQAVMFNLGYLPGGDKRVVTRAASTSRAILAALGLLSRSGIVSVVVYPGHPGGREEADAVLRLCRSLAGTRFAAKVHKAASPKPSAPFLVTVEPVVRKQG